MDNHCHVYFWRYLFPDLVDIEFIKGKNKIEN
jgi:hypothetical protein